jgi:selenocysteine-specific elongation factor
MTPRSLILGTAGHIDHGKSALVRALTGTDPDRLPEEKERGITVDLGFAHLELEAGRVASFVDVPGHERFVRNMLAGAHGIDAVLLVVAADEGVMPQTREHFHICRLLGIARGLVVLSKCDLAGAGQQDAAEAQVRVLAAGSFLEGAPVLRVSSRTGAGLDTLRAALSGLAASAAARAPGGLLRLPVDRSFTMRGFGTVVTGTLVSGALAVGDEVEVLPAGKRARVRGLQVHGAAQEQVEAGHRCAANLAGVGVAEVARGDVIARPGTLRPASIVDVELTLLPGVRPLADHARVRVHVASAEVLGRVRLSGPLAPGATQGAQLRLESPAVSSRGDRLVLRAYSPAETIGGALVLDPAAAKRRRAAAPPPAPGLDAAAAAVALVEAAGPAGVEAGRLAARLGLTVDALAGAVEGEARLVRVGRAGAFLARAALDALKARALEELAAFHRREPLRAGMPRPELRERTCAHAPEGAFERLLDEAAGDGLVQATAEAVALAGQGPRLSAPQSAGREAVLQAARLAGLEGLAAARSAHLVGGTPREAEGVVRLLVSEGLLQRVGDALVARAALDALKEDVRRRWAPGARLDVGAVKELTGLSRKFVIPLLEYLDRERVTRRQGAERTVIA